MGFFMLFMLTPLFHRIEALPNGVLILRVLVAPLAVLGAPASLIICFGMVAFYITEDRSSTSAKIFWCLLFFLGAPFASAAYFFSVYRRQVAEASIRT
jgi:hypothetical protein